jgi:hypothetical protein
MTTIDGPGGLIGPEFLDTMDQPLLLLEGVAHRDAMARTSDEERALPQRLNLLPA